MLHSPRETKESGCLAVTTSISGLEVSVCPYGTWDCQAHRERRGGRLSQRTVRLALKSRSTKECSLQSPPPASPPPPPASHPLEPPFAFWYILGVIISRDSLQPGGVKFKYIYIKKRKCVEMSRASGDSGSLLHSLWRGALWNRMCGCRGKEGGIGSLLEICVPKLKGKIP